MNPIKVGILVASVVGVIALLTMVGSVFETNYAGNYQVKQASFSGDLSVRSNPGVYWQGFGDITTYPNTYTLYFSSKDSEDGAHETDAVEVRFNDAGTAKISGQLQIRFPQTEADQLRLHQDYKSFEAVSNNVIRPLVKGSLMATAALLKAEESYSSRRAEFAQLAEEQIRLGLFETIAEEAKTKDVEGNDFIERTVKVRKNANGSPIVQRPSALSAYGMEVVQFVLNEIDFDSTVDTLITKKKEAEQQKVVARANAERAKQDAITSEEQGKARVAEAKATKEVEKIEAVTAAQKEAEVAEWNKKRDAENAAAQLVTARAEAEGARLKVAAGLTPLERAQIDKETKVEVAKALANIKPPSVVISGGNNNGQGADFLTMMSVKAALSIADDMDRKATANK